MVGLLVVVCLTILRNPAGYCLGQMAMIAPADVAAGAFRSWLVTSGSVTGAMTALVCD